MLLNQQSRRQRLLKKGLSSLDHHQQQNGQAKLSQNIPKQTESKAVICKFGAQTIVRWAVDHHHVAECMAYAEDPNENDTDTCY